MGETRHMRRTDRGIYRYIKILVITTTILTVALVVLLVCWGLCPYEPIEIRTENPIPLVGPEPTHVVEQGGHITYEFEMHDHDHAPPVVRREFVDGIVFHIEESERSSRQVSADSGMARTRIHIPETLPPGEYFLRITIQIEVNPIRVWEANLTTERFTVIARTQ